jgi:hypothetical protein
MGVLVFLLIIIAPTPFNDHFLSFLGFWGFSDFELFQRYNAKMD